MLARRHPAVVAGNRSRGRGRPFAPWWASSSSTRTHISCDWFFIRDAFQLDVADPFVSIFRTTYEAVSGRRLPEGPKPFVDDGNSFWAIKKIPAITHGPRAGGQHTVAEWVEIDDLVRVAIVYAATASNIPLCPDNHALELPMTGPAFKDLIAEAETTEEAFLRQIFVRDQMAEWSKQPLVMARADGVYYWDVAGKRTSMRFSGIYVASVGHNKGRDRGDTPPVRRSGVLTADARNQSPGGAACEPAGKAGKPGDLHRPSSLNAAALK